MWLHLLHSLVGLPRMLQTGSVWLVKICDISRGRKSYGGKGLRKRRVLRREWKAVAALHSNSKDVDDKKDIKYH